MPRKPDIKILRQLAIDEVAFVDKGAGGNDRNPVKIAIFKRRKENGDYDDDEENSVQLEAALASLDEEKRKVIEAALVAAATKQDAEEDEEEKQEASEDEEDEEEKQEAPDEEEEEEEEAKAMKALPASLRKRFAAERAERQSLAKRLAEMETKAEIEKFQKRAAKYASVPAISKKQLGSVLRSCSKHLDSKDMQALEQCLAATDSAMSKSSLFREVGTSAGGASSGSAIGKIRAIAKSIEQSSPGMTSEEAFAKAAENNPELYTEHQAERRSRN